MTLWKNTNIRLFLIVFVLSGVYGCAAGLSFTDIIPIPVPDADFQIQSVSYLKNKYGVDLLSKIHDMQKEIEASHIATNLVNGVLNVSVNGEKVNTPYNDKHFYNSKKIGTNDYTVTVSNIAPIEKQIGRDFCWAASLQYFLSREYGISVSQQSIVDEIKKGQPSDDLAASTMDMLKALGFTGLKLNSGGSKQLIEALGRDHIAIIGIKNPNDDVGHAVVVTAARYSFYNPINLASNSQDSTHSQGINAGDAGDLLLNTSPAQVYNNFFGDKVYVSPGGKLAFSEITYLDPAEGKITTARGEELDGKVGFVLTKYLTGK